MRRRILLVLKTIQSLPNFLIATVSATFLLFPSFQEYIDQNYYHYIDTIKFPQWISILLIWSGFYLILNLAINSLERQESEKYKPLITFSKYGKDDVYQHANMYGANSFIAKGLITSRKLVFIDFANNPKEKRLEESNAKNIFVSLKFYGSDGTSLYHKNFIGRWVGMPEIELGENHTTISLSSNGLPERLGIGYMDNKSDYLILLDSYMTDLSANGIYINPEILPRGDYVMISTVNGENILKPKSMVFDISVKYGDIEIHAKDKGIEWVKKAEKRIIDLWEPKGVIDKVKYKLRHRNF
jgi:hypothetical protein